MKKLVEVKIDSLRVSLTNQQRIVVLKQVDEIRFLPVWIGPYEAESITIALQEIEVSRPQTHDLIKNVLTVLEAKIQHVEISELREDIFYGTLVVIKEGKTMRIDCRPSDAIAVAVRAHVPIMVAKAVMDEASIIPEEISAVSEEEDSSNIEEREEGGKLAPNEERLSIFEEYLKKNTKRTSPTDEDQDADNNLDEDDKSASPG